MTANQSLKKNERLKGLVHFRRLAQEGKQFFAHPLKLVWIVVEAEKPEIKIATVAPKKLFKKAPDRNLIKRKMREAYRTQKEPFLALNNNLHLLWVYISKNPKDVALIPEAMLKLADKLKKELTNKTL